MNAILTTEPATGCRGAKSRPAEARGLPGARERFGVRQSSGVCGRPGSLPKRQRSGPLQTAGAPTAAARTGAARPDVRATWLPAPPPAPSLGASSAFRPAVLGARKPLWILPAAEPLSEKLVLGVVALGAALGIGYGLSCVVDLVQHWALFATLDKLVQ